MAPLRASGRAGLSTRRGLLAALLSTALLAAPSVSRAEGPAFNPSGAKLYDLQLFHPAVDTKGYIGVNASQVLGLWDFSIGLVGTLANRPLYLEQNDKTFAVDYVFTPTLQAALGFKYLELAVTLPVQLSFGGASPAYAPSGRPNDANSLSFSGQGIGDVGIHLKGRFLNTSKHPVGLGLIVSGYVPSGNAAEFLGDGSFGLVPMLIVDKEFGAQRRFRMALNVGAHIRTGGTHKFTDKGQRFTDKNYTDAEGNSAAAEVCGPTVDDDPRDVSKCGTRLSRSLGTQIKYGIGASYAVIKERFDVLAEIYGAAGVDGSASSYPLEGLLGAKVYLARNSFFSLGGGASIIPNQTQGARWRVFFGFVFEPSIGDRDGDGIKDDVDKCPDDPEDHDDFEDTDGCPDPDNDRDGILDREDKCPNDPETKNGFQDDDGCPDEVETDRDGDGIPDSKDKCADDPEDKDAFEDADGCPDPDNDKDTVLDVDDSCPNDPEDLDGFEDQDGCPDPDNDKDRILDKDDKCPNEPEVYNGFEDKDGCPDKGRVVVRRGRIEILDKIYFETDKAIIKPESFSLLDAIAATLIGNPEILQVEIQGHADERGDDAHNLQLTEDRAQSVRKYLVDHNVEAGRLKARGYGETKPVCPDKTEECWSKNRRVEFVILKRADD